MTQSGESGPWVAVAVVCKDVTVDPGSGLFSIQDIITTWSVPRETLRQAPTPGAIPTLKGKFLVLLHAGEATGTVPLELWGESPSGRRWLMGQENIDFEEPRDSGIFHTGGIVVNAYEVGVHWIDVVVGGRLLTKIAFRVRHVGEV